MMLPLMKHLFSIPPTPCVQLLLLRSSEGRGKKGFHLRSQVLLGSSALMQQDVALTEAACPLSKSNYDKHASGKAAARRAA
ncbi:hypothetical protein PBY51_022111 [Eleginops maclovinus]|uniref:Uncharacterized protein n=1 Tax=Eleginops maclovinus TaxID=56733 RepID=A0AAN7XHA3_ELEMC|nr:hypothetical protein PBY51_022111 [Eleginops maclovinus]